MVVNKFTLTQQHHRCYLSVPNTHITRTTNNFSRKWCYLLNVVDNLDFQHFTFVGRWHFLQMVDLEVFFLHVISKKPLMVFLVWCFWVCLRWIIFVPTLWYTTCPWDLGFVLFMLVVLELYLYPGLCLKFQRLFWQLLPSLLKCLCFSTKKLGNVITYIASAWLFYSLDQKNNNNNWSVVVSLLHFNAVNVVTFKNKFSEDQRVTLTLL